MPETLLEMQIRVVDRELARTDLPMVLHAYWVGQRARLDRMAGDKSFRKLMEDANDSISRADADC